MLEEIEALIPLFDKMTEGAIWAFVIYMFVNLVSIIIWPLVSLGILLVVKNGFVKVWSSTSVINHQVVDVVDIQNDNTLKKRYIGDKDKLGEFFASLSKCGYVYESDLKGIQEKLKE